MAKPSGENNPTENPQPQPPQRPAETPSTLPARHDIEEHIPGTYTETRTDISEEAKKYLDLKEISPDELSAAQFAIENALLTIKASPTIQAVLVNYGIKIRPVAYYLALAIKESLLNPTTQIGGSKKAPDSWVVGYFQLKKTALDEVNKRFGTSYAKADIFSKAPINTQEQMRASTNNAVVGILFWHICEKMSVRKERAALPPQDQDKITAMVYFLGANQFVKLYQQLGKPKSFDELSKKVAKRLAQEFPFLQYKEDEVANQEKAYSISTSSHLSYGKLSASQIFDKLQGKKVKIGKYEFRADNLFESIRYPQILEKLIVSASFKSPIVFTKPPSKRK